MSKRHQVHCKDTGEVFVMVEELTPSRAISGPREDISTFYLEDSGQVLRRTAQDQFVGVADDRTYTRIG